MYSIKYKAMVMWNLVMYWVEEANHVIEYIDAGQKFNNKSIYLKTDK